jgi:site-specific DNA-methyltransferase (adenine-specific)
VQKERKDSVNRLHLGDCLYVLRERAYFPDSFVDLIYIDPPFNSKRNYNIFFDDNLIRTQHVAFDDTWTLVNIATSLTELNTLETSDLYKLLQSYRITAPQTFPYLVMMSLRIIELHRVLKPTGAFFIHCDPTMSHYLKTVCDVIFGGENFRNEIVWKRQSAHSDAKNKFANVADIILFYAKSNKFKFIPQYAEHDEGYIKRFYRHDDEDERGPYQLDNMASPNPRPNMMYEWKGFQWPTKGWRYQKSTMEKLDSEGRIWYPTKKDGSLDLNKRPRLKRYLEELEGSIVTNIWTDIQPLHAVSEEYMGFPTQKPLLLLERIIASATKKNDLVLDAFSGCGTSVDAAEGMHRRWIGIDISPTAISRIKWRLEKTYRKSLSPLEIRGIPTDQESGIKLWQENPNAFQDWWVSEFEALSPTYGGKGADKGADGLALYNPDNKGSVRVAFQVKGGGIGSKDMDALIGAMSKFNCEMGIFLTIEKPTRQMLNTVAGAGNVRRSGYSFPVLQTLTLKQFFEGEQLVLPPNNITFNQAKYNTRKTKAKQLLLEDE